MDEVDEIDFWIFMNAPELYKCTSKPSVWNAVYTSVQKITKTKKLENIEFEDVNLPPCKHKRCKVFCSLQKCKQWNKPEYTVAFDGYSEHIDLQVNVMAKTLFQKQSADNPKNTENHNPNAHKTHKDARTHILKLLERFMELTPHDKSEPCILFWLENIKNLL